MKLRVETNLTSEVEISPKLRTIVCIELNNLKAINIENIQFFQKVKDFNLSYLHGFYAFVLVFSDDGRQYMLVKPLKDFESNHGYLNLFLKKINGYNPQQPLRIVAGGEINFLNGELKAWNLKSLNYSVGGLFDINHPEFKENLDSIQLPLDKYQDLETAKKLNLSDIYTSHGSYKLFKSSPSDEPCTKENDPPANTFVR